MKTKKVYIAGPYTKGDVVLNVRAAITMAEGVAAHGHIPYVPHTTMLWHMIMPHTPEFWYQYDKEWLAHCDALIRIPGESVGADAEVEKAEELGIQVYYSLGDFIKDAGNGSWRR